MKLIDTNILIYSAELPYRTLLLPLVTDSNNVVSVVSHIETLGFQQITDQQIKYFTSIFQILNTVPIDDAVVNEAIRIRRIKKITLGDALLAATAIVHDLELVTRNISDFSGIEGLKVSNPLAIS